jgi:hypothetical protein
MCHSRDGLGEWSSITKQISLDTCIYQPTEQISLDTCIYQPTEQISDPPISMLKLILCNESMWPVN